MKCPICAAWVEIKDSRTRRDNTRLRRYRCGNDHRFSTVERVEVVKIGAPRKHLAP